MLRKYPVPQPGDTFERLTILEAIPVPQRWSGKPQARYPWYRCQCICGTIKELSSNTWHNRNTRSCGCLQREKAAIVGALKGTHHEAGRYGHRSASKEYRAWRHMRNRCLNKNVERYPHYGGRGITVCQQWLDSYETFLADVGRAPSPLHSLGRLDNNGHYEPGNVAWQTTEEQVRNASFNRHITYQNTTLILSDWARKLGIKRRTLHMRLDARGWSVEKAFTTPVKH